MNELHEIIWKKGAVVLVDFLGISRSADKSTCEYFINKRKELLEIIPIALQDSVSLRQAAHSQVFKKHLPPINRPLIRSFQDTIMMVWPYEEVAAVKGSYQEGPVEFLMMIAHALGVVFKEALQRKTLLRGAVSFGDYYESSDLDDKVFLGPAVTEAAEWYDRTDWAGIVLTPRTGYILDAEINADNLNLIMPFYTKYGIPVKGKEGLELWSISWPYHFFDGSDKTQDKISEYYSLFSSFSYIPADEVAKYINTHNYFRNYTDKIILEKDIGQPRGAAPTQDKTQG